ncbi:hypothetical protein M514_11703 [Trichuris suis]|uniref:Tc1-like transposase DDE domain-containing protein n=1 Tax=Trichuris suis TaxID=68888 RepID=A0A085NCH2_9BILA|nr:hypothetical protein M513_11703 [Trichuris suis]KFD67168.1 hypothetical protein M514_11703 [Trichuris suis]
MTADKVMPYYEGYDLVFMNDGAPAHYAASVRNYLNELSSTFVDWEKGAKRSSDLTTPNFFRWGSIRSQL